MVVAPEAFGGKSGLVDGSPGTDWLLGRIEMLDGACGLIVGRSLYYLVTVNYYVKAPLPWSVAMLAEDLPNDATTVDYKAEYILLDLGAIRLKF